MFTMSAQFQTFLRPSNIVRHSLHWVDFVHHMSIPAQKYFSIVKASYSAGLTQANLEVAGCYEAEDTQKGQHKKLIVFISCSKKKNCQKKQVKQHIFFQAYILPGTHLSHLRSPEFAFFHTFHSVFFQKMRWTLDLYLWASNWTKFGFFLVGGIPKCAHCSIFSFRNCRILSETSITIYHTPTPVKWH